MKAKRRKGEQVISSSLDRILTNIEYLPQLYEAITNKTVMEIEYKPYETSLQVTLSKLLYGEGNIAARRAAMNHQQLNLTWEIVFF